MAQVRVEQLHRPSPRITFRRPALGWGTMLVLSLCGAGLTGLLAQVRVLLPGTPVPVTGQTFAILLCGALLGARYGALSQVIYIAIGAAGLPWFQGGVGGMAILRGFTAGYLVGFVAAAGLVGYITQRFQSCRSFPAQVTLMTLGAALILLLGSIHLAGVLQVSLGAALLKGALPFASGDIFKAILAALITSAIFSRERSPSN